MDGKVLTSQRPRLHRVYRRVFPEQVSGRKIVVLENKPNREWVAGLWQWMTSLTLWLFCFLLCHSSHTPTPRTDAGNISPFCQRGRLKLSWGESTGEPDWLSYLSTNQNLTKWTESVDVANTGDVFFYSSSQKTFRKKESFFHFGWFSPPQCFFSVWMEAWEVWNNWFYIFNPSGRF